MSNIKFVIEKGVKMPSNIRGKTPLYPFRDMQVGDSFVAPIGIRHKLQCAASAFSARHPGFKFSCKEDKETKTFRVWRVAVDQEKKV